MTKTIEQRPSIGLDSYDRFFPNQDTLPKGGFGNLIALPLQRIRVRDGNSLFIGENLQPYPDQWEFLSSIRKMKEKEVEDIVQETQKTPDVARTAEDLKQTRDFQGLWSTLQSSRTSAPLIQGPFPASVQVVLSNGVYIEKKSLPLAFVNRLIRLAAFENPEFYKKQAMCLPTYDQPRVINCAEDFGDYLGLPRGCLNEACELFLAHGIRPDVVDERYEGKHIQAEFVGQLQPWQQQAADALLANDTGVLSAAAAFGKTVIAAYLVARRGVSTLILVQRRQLLDQWKERLAQFLNVPGEYIGQLGGGKFAPTGYIDVAILKSLNPARS